MSKYEIELPIGKLSAPSISALIKIIEQEDKAWDFTNTFDPKSQFFPHRSGEFTEPMAEFAKFWSGVFDSLEAGKENSATEKFELVKSAVERSNFVPPQSSSGVGPPIKQLGADPDTYLR